MSRDTILTDDDGVKYSYDNIRGQGYHDGHMGGLQDVMVYLKREAVRLFEQDEDEKAREMKVFWSTKEIRNLSEKEEGVSI